MIISLVSRVANLVWGIVFWTRIGENLIIALFACYWPFSLFYFSLFAFLFIYNCIFREFSLQSLNFRLDFCSTLFNIHLGFQKVLKAKIYKTVWKSHDKLLSTKYSNQIGFKLLHLVNQNRVTDLPRKYVCSVHNQWNTLFDKGQALIWLNKVRKWWNVGKLDNINNNYELGRNGM